MATFGETGSGTDDGGLTTYNKGGCYFVLPVSGQITELHAWAKASSIRQAVGAVYQYAPGSAFLFGTGSITIPNTSTLEDHTFTPATPQTLAPGSYVLAFKAGGSWTTRYYADTDRSATDGDDNLNDWDPAWVGGSGDFAVDLRRCFYAVYTAVGPVNFTQSISDSISLTESTGRTGNTDRQLTQLYALLDFIGRSYATTKSETTTISDSKTINPNLSKAEVIALADSKTMQNTISKTDLEALHDLLTRVATYGRALKEDAKLTDAKAFLLSQLKADSISFSDMKRTLTTLKKTDRVTYAEQTNRLFNLMRLDNLSVKDTMIRNATYLRGLAELAIISDVLSFSFEQIEAFLEQLSDAVSLADKQSKSVSRVLSEAISLLDRRSIGAVIRRSELTGFLEGISKQLKKQLSEPVLITDRRTTSVGVKKDEIVDLSDNTNRQVGMNLIEGISLEDLSQLSTEIKRDEAIAILENLSTQLGKEFTENILIQEAMSNVVGYLLSLGDTITIADLMSLFSGFITRYNFLNQNKPFIVKNTFQK